MFILFGTKGITYSSGDGSFFCPTCRTERRYQKKRVRRFFTLYFIPVIPLDLIGEFVECQQCKGTYRTEILNYNPQSQQMEIKAEFERVMKRVMVAMMLADGKIDAAETGQIVDVFNKITGRKISESEIREEISTVQKERLPIGDYLKKIAPILNSRGKELVVSAAFYIAVADGRFQDEEKASIIEIAKALEITPAHLNGIFAQLTQADAITSVDKS